MTVTAEENAFPLLMNYKGCVCDAVWKSVWTWPKEPHLGTTGVEDGITGFSDEKE